MTIKTIAVAPSLIRSSVTQTPKTTDPHGEILQAIGQLKRERQSQAQLNHHARLCRDECEQHSAIAIHHSARAERFAKEADRTARNMPDPLAIILISIGTSFLISLAVFHLSGQNNAPKPPIQNIRTERPFAGG